MTRPTTQLWRSLLSYLDFLGIDCLALLNSRISPLLPTPHPPMLEMRIACHKDLPAIAALDQLSLGGIWSLDAYGREIDSPNSDLWLLAPILPVANSAVSKQLSLNPSNTPPALVGFACLWAILEEAHITILAVHPEHRRRGYGRMLLTALLQSAHQRGLEWATLEVRPSNQAAVRLYQSFGFEEVGRRRRYYSNDEDALILWRKGLQTPAFQMQLQSWLSQYGLRTF